MFIFGIDTNAMFVSIPTYSYEIQLFLGKLIATTEILLTRLYHCCQGEPKYVLSLIVYCNNADFEVDLKVPQNEKWRPACRGR
jgi:hypothetical protein